MLYWEGKFHQNNVSYNSENGMTYDGTQLDWTTGVATRKHGFSAASKEVSLAFSHPKVLFALLEPRRAEYSLFGWFN